MLIVLFRLCGKTDKQNILLRAVKCIVFFAMDAIISTGN